MIRWTSAESPPIQTTITWSRWPSVNMRICSFLVTATSLKPTLQCSY